MYVALCVIYHYKSRSKAELILLVLEFKAYGKDKQFSAIDEALRTVQFICNKALQFWKDGLGKAQYDLNKYCVVLAKEFPFANELNSMARQSSAERAWSAIARFYAALASSRGTRPRQCFDNCKKKISEKKGYPQFQKDKGTRDLHFYQFEQIKRVRLVKRADGYYVQFRVSIDRSESVEPSGIAIGLDVGLNDFYTDSNGHSVENPRFLRKGTKKIRQAQRCVSKRLKGQIIVVKREWF